MAVWSARWRRDVICGRQDGETMDGDRFDQFTRSLARNVSRRSVVKGLTMLVAGASVAARPLTG
jgi:hypothetical protein